MKKLKKIIYLPIFYLIFSAYLPFLFYVNNAYQFNLNEVLFATVVMMGIAFLVYLAIKIVIGSQKSAIIVSLILFSLFIPNLYLKFGIIISIAALILIVTVLRSKVGYKINLILNLFSSLLLCFQIYDLHSIYINENLNKFENISLKEMNKKPDIYHFVLDGYSNETALNNFYHFDNSYFISQLKGLGFTIYSDAISPYNWTPPIMSSIFNLGYVFDENSNNDISTRVQMYQLRGSAYNGIVPSYLLNNGYNFSYIPSGFGFFSLPNTYNVDNIDTKDNVNNDTFLYVYIRALWWINKQHSVHERTMKALSFKSYSKLPKPFFYYAHILSPHPPFNIDRYGNITNKYNNFNNSINDGSDSTHMDPTLISEYRKGYIDKLIYTNKKIIEQLTFIIKNMTGDKIIIVHGDHGGGSSMNYNKFENSSFVMERYKPLLAIYKAGDNNKEINQPYSLVNIYRDIISQVSDNNLPSLPSKTFFSPWGKPESIKEFDINFQKQPIVND